jgi:hypothetical protein
MKSKVLLCVLVISGLTTGQVLAQEFELSSFADDIEELMHKLEIGEKEMDKFVEVYKSLNKSLLALNEEIAGKNIKELEGMIEKKFAAANESFKESMKEEQFIVVQNLNDELSKSLIDALVGEKGLIGTHGLVDEEGMIAKEGKRGQISIVVGTCIK